MNRIEKLRRLLGDRADGVIVTSNINQLYLCGFDFSDGYVLVTKSNAYVFCDFRYIEAARASVNGCTVVELTGGKRDATIGAVLREDGVKRLAYEDNTLTCAALESMKKGFPETELIPLGDVIDGEREFKEPCEVDCIIAAQRIAEEAFAHILGFITPERTETEVALELEYFMRKKGATGTSFNTIAVSGKASSLPHGVPRNVPLERGFFTLDYGAVYGGYCSDMTRTVCIGPADGEMKKVYETVRAAQAAALEKAAVGVPCGEVDRAARELIEAAGYGKCFGHGTGHGVGMYIHEAPRVAPQVKTPLAPGHIITVEPGIYLEGSYGVRIEDMVYITEKEAIDITKAPKELIQL